MQLIAGIVIGMFLALGLIITAFGIYLEMSKEKNPKIERKRLRNTRQYWFGKAEIIQLYNDFMKNNKSNERFGHMLYHYIPFITREDAKFADRKKFATWRKTEAYKLACEDFLHSIKYKAFLQAFCKRCGTPKHDYYNLGSCKSCGSYNGSQDALWKSRKKQFKG